jgi:hypothetical protein
MTDTCCAVSPYDCKGIPLLVARIECPKANEAKVVEIKKILNSCELCSRFKIKRVCIKCKPGFKNPKAPSTEVMPSDTPLTQCYPLYHQLILC